MDDKQPTESRATEARAEACLLRGARLSVRTASKFTEQGAPAQDAPRPIDILARTFEPAYTPFWFGGVVYHDFDGLRMHKDRITVDYEHRDPIGYCEDPRVVEGEGLMLSGKLVPAGGDDDPARVVMKRGDEGVPYEASIDFYGPASVEYVEAGISAEVNGETVEGPCTIVREWTLRGVAIAPYGVDMHAETQFAGRAPAKLSVRGDGPGEKVVVTAPGNAAAMSNSNDAATPPADSTPADSPADEAVMTDGDGSAAPAADAAEGQGEVAPIPAEATTDAPADDAQSKFRAELKRYTDRFGPAKGAELFSSGVPYQDALERQYDETAKQLAVANQRLSGKQAADEAGPGEDDATGSTTADPGAAKKKTGFATKLNLPN